jgi:DNA-binding transcriptional LysR family regulator
MLDRFHHFLLIANEGSFSKAARRAHLSQPALTASIHKLEEDMGASLFHRSAGGTTLTCAGQALVPFAQAALAAIEDGKRAIAEVEGLQVGEVRIGAGATACTYLLPPMLALFRVQRPGLRLLLREAPTASVLDALQAGELDLGIISSDEGDPWLLDELILVSAPNLSLSDPPFVTFGKGATTRQMLEHHFPDANIVMELGSIAAVKGHVRAGIGIALVSRSAVAYDLKVGLLAEVSSPKTPIQRTLSIVHRGVDRLPPAAAALRELLLQLGEKHKQSAHLLASPLTPTRSPTPIETKASAKKGRKKVPS